MVGTIAITTTAVEVVREDNNNATPTIKIAAIEDAVATPVEEVTAEMEGIAAARHAPL